MFHLAPHSLAERLNLNEHVRSSPARMPGRADGWRSFAALRRAVPSSWPCRAWRCRGSRYIGAFWTAVLLVSAATPAPLRAQPSSAAASSAYSENEIKAAFLYNFGSYVQWPSNAAATDPVTFAVLNAPGIEQALEGLVQGRTLQSRPVRVRRLRSINELDGEEVLFIGAAENWRLPQLIASVRGPTLIVTDALDGLAAGSMINFQLVDQRVRFEVGLPAADAAGLMLSSRLLSAALRVETTRCGLECRDTQPIRAPRSIVGIAAQRPGGVRIASRS